MRKSLLILSAGLLFVAGCKEIGPDIGLSKPISVSADTAYVLTAIPPADAHNVLVEDFTGQACPNCPRADTNLENEANGYTQGRVNIISLFAAVAPQTTPPLGSKHDLESSMALEIANNGIYGGLKTGLPTIGVDRRSIASSSGLWDVAIEGSTNVTDSLNVSVQSNYTGSVATCTVTVTYTQQILYSQSINIALLEDSIIDFHEEPQAMDSMYLYMNVFRGLVTQANGDLIYPQSPAKKPQGLFYRRVYTYQLPAVLTNNIYNNPAIVAKHCRVIAFITNSIDGSIAQSAQTPLMGQ
jgi:hypothetical protein